MSLRNVPILLSFSAISNGSDTLIHGQLTHTPIRDLSFIDFGRRRTFRTLLRLYRTRPYARKDARLIFDRGAVSVRTDAHGSFTLKVSVDQASSSLQEVRLASGIKVKLIDGLYQRDVQQVRSGRIVVSDIDDTLVHSFIGDKFKTFRTLMLTAVEKRRAVETMSGLIKRLAASGVTPFYLSNSEQNLYPLIYRFLLLNDFPEGPIFLKKLRGLWDVVRNIKRPFRHLHKEYMLEEIIRFFPEAEFILMGDNTQYDLLIYLSTAEKFPGRVRQVIIRKVMDKEEDERILSLFGERLKQENIQVHYSAEFPDLLAG